MDLSSVSELFNWWVRRGNVIQPGLWMRLHLVEPDPERNLLSPYRPPVKQFT